VPLLHSVDLHAHAASLSVVFGSYVPGAVWGSQYLRPSAPPVIYMTPRSYWLPSVVLNAYAASLYVVSGCCMLGAVWGSQFLIPSAPYHLCDPQSTFVTLCGLLYTCNLFYML
jgi:hypothetical protein